MKKWAKLFRAMRWAQVRKWKVRIRFNIICQVKVIALSKECLIGHELKSFFFCRSGHTSASVFLPDLQHLVQVKVRFPGSRWRRSRWPHWPGKTHFNFFVIHCNFNNLMKSKWDLVTPPLPTSLQLLSKHSWKTVPKHPENLKLQVLILKSTLWLSCAQVLRQICVWRDLYFMQRLNKCEECGKTFTRKSVLEKHMLKHQVCLL